VPLPEDEDEAAWVATYRMLNDLAQKLDIAIILCCQCKIINYEVEEATLPQPQIQLANSAGIFYVLHNGDEQAAVRYFDCETEKSWQFPFLYYEKDSRWNFHQFKELAPSLPIMRVELCANTCCGTLEEWIGEAVQRGYKAIGFLESLQTFPKIMKAAKKHAGHIKVLYGTSFDVLSEGGTEEIYSVNCHAKNSEGIANLYRLAGFVRKIKIQKSEAEAVEYSLIPENEFWKNTEGLLISCPCSFSPWWKPNADTNIRKPDFLTADPIFATDPNVAYDPIFSGDADTYGIPCCAAGVGQVCDLYDLQSPQGIKVVKHVSTPTERIALLRADASSDYRHLAHYIARESSISLDLAPSSFAGSQLSLFRDGFAVVYDGDRIDFSADIMQPRSTAKWGVIDKTGAVVIPFEYDYISNFNDGLAVVFIGFADFYHYAFYGSWGILQIIPA